MQSLTAGIGFVDLDFLGHPGVIATAVLHGSGGAALVDPGPATCLPTLRARLSAAGIGRGDLRSILLSHIHLDHAGATGILVREHPGLQVFVHERGAPHLADPSRLLASASRLYGADMDRLWGQVLPVPTASIRPLAGGERVSAGSRELEVACTPGHASHHVSYFDRSSGLAFVGDTAGIRLMEAPYVVPPTPPPDIDLDIWRESIRRIEAWRPDTLFLTHFGPSPSPTTHLQELLDRLDEAARLVRASLDEGGAARTDEERAKAFAGEWGRLLRRRMSEEAAVRYELASPARLSWLGLARYWRRRADVPADRRV